jgi:hypothetical protein
VSSFGNEAYPAGVGGTVDFFVHDTVEDDHMPGVLAGGQGMLAMLSAPARVISEGYQDQYRDAPDASTRDLLKWGKLVPAATLLDSVTSEVRKLYAQAITATAANTPLDVSTVEQKYASLMQLADLPYEPHVFALTVLEGFADASSKMGLTEQALNMAALAERYKVFVHTGEPPFSQPRMNRVLAGSLVRRRNLA